MTYAELGAIPPDQTLYLDVPAEISARLLTKEGKNDQHEANIAYQESVREMYRMLARERSDWRHVDCAPDGVLRSPESIHKEIWGMLKPILSIG